MGSSVEYYIRTYIGISSRVNNECNVCIVIRDIYYSYISPFERFFRGTYIGSLIETYIGISSRANNESNEEECYIGTNIGISNRAKNALIIHISNENTYITYIICSTGNSSIGFYAGFNIGSSEESYT